ncbi:MAG: sigma-70 family RNA polymerase sigma factor [Phycisphaeraceae bacterium]|nr:sigma-70 family RNA polymerase sigma factor [Phycisphaeraceae bacterium]
MDTEQSRREPGGMAQAALTAVASGAPQGVPDRDEIELWATRAMSGERGAVEEVWRLNRRWVAAILLAHKPRWAEVEDLLQEVAISLVRKVHEVREAKAFRPWLRTVAVNVALAAARSGKRRAGESRLNTGEGHDDAVMGHRREDLPPPEILSDSEQGSRLMALAMELPDGYREPLLLKAVQGLSYREIGEILDLPETTIETRVARGRRMLRDLAHKNELTATP